MNVMKYICRREKEEKKEKQKNRVTRVVTMELTRSHWKCRLNRKISVRNKFHFISMQWIHNFKVTDCVGVGYANVISSTTARCAKFVYFFSFFFLKTNKSSWLDQTKVSQCTISIRIYRYMNSHCDYNPFVCVLSCELWQRHSSIP